MVESGDASSKSAAVNELIEAGERVNILENKNDELQKKLRIANRKNDVDDKLVRYVEHDIDWHEAGIGTKVRWFIFGKG